MLHNKKILFKPFFSIAVIILVAFSLRIININSNPPGLYGDELTMVYDTFSILKTGHDQLGDFLPLTFKMGAGRPAGYVYASIPFVALFGPSALGVRMLSILSGIGILILVYLFGKKLFNEKVGLTAAFLLAISPWDINLSRGGFEAHFALFLTLLGIWTFFSSKFKPWLLIISSLSFVLAVHTYPTYKITVPLMFVLLIGFTKDKKALWTGKIKNYLSAAILILTIGGLLSLIQTFTAGSESRFLSINAFSQQQLRETIIQKINYERVLGGFSLLHNKPIEYGLILGESYIKNFSFDFLFLHGDRNPRHNMTTMGEFYLIELLFIIFGIIYLSRIYKKELMFLVIWVLISPLPAALLLEPHALRSALMLPPLILISAAGFFYLWNNLREKNFFWVRGLIVVVLIINFIFFTERLFVLSPKQSGRFWSSAAKEASAVAMKEKSNYKWIILSDKIDNIEYAYPVYNRIDPNKVIEENRSRKLINGLYFKKLDNVLIGQIPDGDIEKFLQNLDPPNLYIGVPEEGRYFKDIEIRFGLDGLASFIIKKVN